jgi:hypothetical protein
MRTFGATARPPRFVATTAVDIFLYPAAMKTTLSLRADLLAEAKARAARERTTLTRLVEEGLALRLQGPVRTVRKLPAMPVSRRAGGLRPGIDPTSNRSLLEAAEAP